MASGKQRVPPPGIAAAHLIIASADQTERIKTIKVLGGSVGVVRVVQRQAIDDWFKAESLEKLRAWGYIAG